MRDSKGFELAEDLVARIEQGNTYARSRKNRFRSSSSVVKMVSLALTVASTVAGIVEVLRAAGANDVTVSKTEFLWCVPGRSLVARK